MTDTIKSNGPNGNGEPSPKEREIAAYLADRSEKLDASVAEVAQLKTEMASYKVVIEALQAQRAEMESQVVSMRLERDQAVADRAVYETLFIGWKAQMRAFKIPSAPLVREILEDEVPTIGGA